MSCHAFLEENRVHEAGFLALALQTLALGVDLGLKSCRHSTNLALDFVVFPLALSLSAKHFDLAPMLGLSLRPKLFRLSSFQ